MKKVDDEITELFEQVVTIRKLPILQIFSKSVRESGLSESQIMALVKITMEPEGALVSSVAEKMYIDTPRASRIIDSLVKAGLAKREYGKLGDRRKIQLLPTKKGTDLLKIFVEESMETAREIFADMGEMPKELSANLNVLNTLLLEKMKTLKDE
jgi:DNA-binding MarR family transcriptional regulator